MNNPRTPIWAAALLAAAALCVAFGAFCHWFTPIKMSQDEWWHLKTGKYIYEHGWRPPAHDVMAFTSAGYKWDNHEWLSETLMYLVYRIGEASGFGPARAVIAAKTKILFAAFGFVCLVAWRRSRSLAIALLFAMIAVRVSRWTVQPRPPIVTYGFIAIFQAALYYYRGANAEPQTRLFPLAKREWVLLLGLPAIMLLWCNLHGGFILGGIIIVCWLAGEIVSYLLARSRKNNSDSAIAKRRAFVLVATGALVGLCSLANPFGYRLYLLPGRVMRETALVDQISELLPPSWQYSPEFYLLAIFVAVAAIVSIRRFQIGEALWVAFLGFQAFNHVRHLPLFAIAAAPFAAEIVGRWMRGKLVSDRGRGLIHAAIAAGAAALALIWTFSTRELESYAQRAASLTRGCAYRTQDYPVRVADFIEDAGLEGPMFNDSRYAGYLIWRFSPETHRVFTDMRYDIFGADFLADELTVRRGELNIEDDSGRVTKRAWREILNKYKINFVVIDKLEGKYDEARRIGTNWLFSQMTKSGEWDLIYQDLTDENGLAVFLRNTPENATALARARELTTSSYIYTRPGREDCGL